MNELQQIRELDSIEDCLLPSDNCLEIPLLRLDMQPTSCAIPFVCFGEQKRTYNMNGTGTLHFYTDDYRFNAIYDHPEKVLQHHPMNIVEPNFSLYSETPIAFGMQAVYKKRFIARAMQDRGIRVFVDLNVNSKFYMLNLIGVPRGYSSFCTRGYSDRINQLEFEYEIACKVAGGKPNLFVVYGGGEQVKAVCRKLGAIYVNQVVCIKNKLKSFEKMKESIAFFGQKIDYDKLIPSKEDMFGKQVEQFNKSLK